MSVRGGASVRDLRRDKNKARGSLCGGVRSLRLVPIGVVLLSASSGVSVDGSKCSTRRGADRTVSTYHYVRLGRDGTVTVAHRMGQLLCLADGGRLRLGCA